MNFLKAIYSFIKGIVTTLDNFFVALNTYSGVVVIAAEEALAEAQAEHAAKLKASAKG